VTENLECETLAEFYKQVADFYTLMGDRRVMESRERRRGAVKGLTILWLRLRLEAGEKKQAMSVFDTAMREYACRCRYLPMRARGD